LRKGIPQYGELGRAGDKESRKNIQTSKTISRVYGRSQETERRITINPRESFLPGPQKKNKVKIFQPRRERAPQRQKAGSGSNEFQQETAVGICAIAARM